MDESKYSETSSVDDEDIYRRSLQYAPDTFTQNATIFSDLGAISLLSSNNRLFPSSPRLLETTAVD